MSSCIRCPKVSSALGATNTTVRLSSSIAWAALAILRATPPTVMSIDPGAVEGSESDGFSACAVISMAAQPITIIRAFLGACTCATVDFVGPASDIAHSAAWRALFSTNAILFCTECAAKLLTRCSSQGVTCLPSRSIPSSLLSSTACSTAS